MSGLEVVPFFSLLGRCGVDEPAKAVELVRPAGVDDPRGQPDAWGGPRGASMAQGIALIGVMAWIVVFVASVALLNTLMLSALERRRELGVLRAMGSSRRFALRTVLAEAAGIGIVGAAIGVVFGGPTSTSPPRR